MNETTTQASVSDDQMAQACADAFKPMADAAAEVLATLKDDGGPAFPQPENSLTGEPGMKLRDYFAARAMQALLARPSDSIAGDAYEPEKSSHRVALAARSYEVADAMIAARKQ